MQDEEFSGPLFKRLGLTDTGKGNAHTSGPTLTKPLRKFFPDPTHEPSKRTSVEVILLNEDASGVSVVPTGPAVVQIQGTPAETYLSDINPLRSLMSSGDLMLIEPSVGNERLFRITRVGQASPRFASLSKLAVGSAGVLKGCVAPPSIDEQVAAEVYVADKVGLPFQLFDHDPSWLPSSKRIARSRAFFGQVMKAYGSRCVFAGLRGGSLMVEQNLKRLT